MLVSQGLVPEQLWRSMMRSVGFPALVHVCVDAKLRLSLFSTPPNFLYNCSAGGFGIILILKHGTGGLELCLSSLFLIISARIWKGQHPVSGFPTLIHDPVSLWILSWVSGQIIPKAEHYNTFRHKHERNSSQYWRIFIKQDLISCINIFGSVEGVQYMTSQITPKEYSVYVHWTLYLPKAPEFLWSTERSVLYSREIKEYKTESWWHFQMIITSQQSQPHIS